MQRGTEVWLEKELTVLTCDSWYEGQNTTSRQLLIAAFDFTVEKTKTNLQINSNLSQK